MKKDSAIIQNLKVGDIITVLTKHHEYKLEVVNPKMARVKVTSKNNQLYQEPEIMHVFYSVPATRKEKEKGVQEGIAKGFCLVMDRLITTAIQKISLETK